MLFAVKLIIIMLFVRVPPEDRVGDIGLIGVNPIAPIGLTAGH